MWGEETWDGDGGDPVGIGESEITDMLSKAKPQKVSVARCRFLLPDLIKTGESVKSVDFLAIFRLIRKSAFSYCYCIPALQFFELIFANFLLIFG